MEATRNPKSLMMMIIVAIMFIIVVGVTIFAAMSFVRQPDRGFLFWATTGFILFIETVGFAFIAGLISGSRTTTPVIAASWTVLIVLAVVGIASIAIYHAMRDPNAPADQAFGAILAIEVSLAIVIVLFLRGWDTYFNAAAEPIAIQRKEHATRGRSLQGLIIRMRGLSWADHELARRADTLLKRLDSAQTSLSHSHGGGAGSREAGKAQAVDPAADSQLQSLLADLDAQVSGLEQGEDPAGRLGQVEVLTNRLQGQIAALQLD